MHFAAVLAAVVVSFAVSGCRGNEGPTAPSPSPSPTGAVTYAVVGASDAVGFGSSAPCLPWEDCDGRGYAPLVKRRFQSDGATVTLVNRGLPGAVLSDAMLALGRDIGRTDIPGTFIERVVPFVPANATHISIFAGGNDANVIAQNVRAGRGGADVRAFVDQQVARFGTDLVDMITRLRARAPNARLVVMNLPNLGVAPYIGSLSLTERSIVQRIAVGLTDRINALSAQNVVVVDLMCEPRIYQPGNFSADGFHPSDSGYQVMAELLYPALRNGTAPAPSSTCLPRTVLPAF
jgi:lysophospholipase L1-like esterase